MSITEELYNDVIDIHGDKCVITGDTDFHIHHNLIYGGKAVQNPYFIIPISHKIHNIIHGHGDYKEEERNQLQDLIDYYMLINAPDSELDRYSKVTNLFTKRSRLESKFH